MLATWSFVSLTCLNPAWTSGSSRFTYCWSLAWRILSITLLAGEMGAIVWYFEYPLVLSFFGIGMKTDLFQSCGHYWVFQICWHIKCSTLTASSFRIWNSSAGIPSPPLALLQDPTDFTVHGILQARILEWVAFPSPGDLPNTGIEPRSPTLQVDSLPAEPQGKPKNTGVGIKPGSPALQADSLPTELSGKP